MAPVPFALRRPWMITRDLFQSRAHPDIAGMMMQLGFMPDM